MLVPSPSFPPDVPPSQNANADAAAHATSTVPLSKLRRGEGGRLHIAELPCEDCELLNAMGLTDQCEVRVCRSGEPCIVQVHTTRLGLSAALARRIYVTVSARTPSRGR